MTRLTRVWMSAAAVSALVLLGACAMVVNRGAIEAELRERVQRDYAEPFKAGRIQDWVAVFAPDALAYHNGPPPMKGREAITQFGMLVAKNFRIDTFDVVVDEVRSDGSWALTAGHYSAMFVPRNEQAYAGAKGPRQGKFMFVWERRRGRWKIIADMGNSTDPPP